MKRSTWQDLFATVIILLPLLYLFLVYDQLPAKVPVHFGINGQPNGFVSNNLTWLPIGGLAALAMACYLLFRNIHRIDPKRQVRISSAAFIKIGLAIVLLLSALSVYILYSATHGNIGLARLVYALLGLFFFYIGNLMYSIKPNYFVGIRIPWTLDDEDNWRATHQFAGKLWFALGLIICICTLLLPLRIGVILFMVCTALLTVLPIVYSFLFWRRKKRSEHQL